MSLAFDHLLGEFIKPVRMAPLCSSPDMADMQMFLWKTCVYWKKREKNPAGTAGPSCALECVNKS